MSPRDGIEYKKRQPFDCLVLALKKQPFQSAFSLNYQNKPRHKFAVIYQM